MEKLNNPNISKIINALGADNVRLVGGCVRNSLLNLPIDDIDMATVFPPEKVMEILQSADIKVFPTGIKHGTVTAIIEHTPFEITTLRHDVECHGRHATVEFTDDWKADASRRDFTINALYMDSEGEIYDYFGGLEDIKKGLVRFIGNPNERIKEDGLRILRYFRFLAFYGEAEPIECDINAIYELKEILQTLSGERIQKEMFKLFTANNAILIIKQMNELGILSEIELFVNLKLDSRFCGNDKNINNFSVVFLSSIIDETCVNTISKRWALSNKDKKLLSVLTTKYITQNADIFTLKKIIRKLGKEVFIGACYTSYTRGKINIEEQKTAIDLANNWDILDFPINGSDLLNLGIQEGKEMGYILKNLEHKWEKSEYALTKEELLLEYL